MNAWEQIKHSLSGKIPNEAFQNWFTETRLQQTSGDSISVAVPNEATKSWMEREYADSVRAVILDVNLMINCIKLDRMPQFHQQYRTADVLLIDDVQILGGKERTQDEFFHTFNELYDHQKQIVISSDSPPKSTPGLVERLRSRFEWGLMVDMQPPDLETKMAILDKKSEQEGIHLPEDVRIFMATKTKP